MFGQWLVTRDVHHVVVVNDTVISHFVERAENLSHGQIAIIDKHLGITTSGRQRAAHVTKVNMKQLSLLPKVADASINVFTRFVASAHTKSDAIVFAGNLREKTVEVGKTAEDLGLPK